MTVCQFDGTDDQMIFTPISSQLSNLSNGAGTMAVLCRDGSSVGTVAQLRNDSGSSSAWYHGVAMQNPDQFDDDGMIGCSGGVSVIDAVGGNNYRISGVDWAGGGSGLERFHCSGFIGSAESWTHENSSGSNGGMQTGPGTAGRLLIGSDLGQRYLIGEVALVAIWAGVRFTDADWLNLWTNKKTSDWWNHSAGNPTTLIEMISLTPTDIGAFPSTYSTRVGVSLVALDPTGWTFDGRGGPPPQYARPDADVTTTGWTTAPLWSKIEETPAVDSDFITATAS